MLIVLASYYLGTRSAFWLTFAVIALSDRIIGNSNIFIFTWSGFLIPALFSNRLLNKIRSFLKTKYKILNSKYFILTSVGLTSNLFFYFWTNFGVWLFDSWGMYSKDLSGLLSCYTMGLPFLKNQIISTIIFIPLGYIFLEILLRVYEKYCNANSPQKVFSS